MDLGLFVTLPLAVIAAASDGPLSAGGASERFAEVLVTSYVCEHLDYRVDYKGLAAWGDTITEQLVAEGASPKTALNQIRSDVRSERDYFHRIYGQAIWATGVPLTGASLVLIDRAGSDRQYRFQNTFAERCEKLASSEDAGGFLVAPERRPSGTELSQKVRASIRRLTAR